MPEHSKSEPPEPVPLVEWRDRVSAALLYKYDEKPPSEHLERAVNEAYAAKCTLIEQIGKTKNDPRPAEKKRQLKTAIKELQDCTRIIEQHFFTQPAPGIDMPSQGLESGGLKFNARIAWRDHKLGQLEKIRPVLEQFVENVSDSLPAYEGMAHHVRQTLQMLEALKARYEHAQATSGYDYFGVDRWLPADQAKRLYVTHLMNIFCRLRGENFQDVPIGNPDFNTNPLLRFLNAVSAPIAGKPNLDVGWISWTKTASRPENGIAIHPAPKREVPLTLSGKTRQKSQNTKHGRLSRHG
jgi:hypothetical protein